jgi:uncharacterized repeat protein (TIGR01451 family)
VLFRSLAVDQDGDGHVDPGDTLQWTTEAINTDYYNLVNPWLFDTLPTGLTYVPGTATIVVNSGLATPIPDDSVPLAASLFPFDESGRQIAASIPVDGSLTIRYQTVVDTNYSGSGRICNRALITSTREGIGSAANGASTSCIPVDGLRLTKTSNSGGDPVEVGDTLVYTLTVSNATTSTLSNIIVTDPYPQGLSWVSTNVTRPAIGTVTSTYADDFENTADWQGSTGSTAWFDTAWTDSQDTSTTAGSLRKQTDLASVRARFRPNAAANLALTRQIGNLSTATAVSVSFDYRCAGLESGDAVLAQVQPTSGTGGWVTLATYNNGCNSTSYATATFPLTSGQWGASTRIRFILNAAFDNNDNFYVGRIQPPVERDHPLFRHPPEYGPGHQQAGAGIGLVDGEKVPVGVTRASPRSGSRAQEYRARGIRHANRIDLRYIQLLAADEFIGLAGTYPAFPHAVFEFVDHDMQRDIDLLEGGADIAAYRCGEVAAADLDRLDFLLVAVPQAGGPERQHHEVDRDHTQQQAHTGAL